MNSVIKEQHSTGTIFVIIAKQKVVIIKSVELLKSIVMAANMLHKFN